MSDLDGQFIPMMASAITEAGKKGVTPDMLAEALYVEPATIYAYGQSKKTGRLVLKIATLIALLAKAGATGPLRWICEQAGYRLVPKRVSEPYCLDLPVNVLHLTAATGNVAKLTTDALADNKLSLEEKRLIRDAAVRAVEQAESLCEACEDESQDDAVEGRR